MGKHVIILGAGASFSSGYPIGTGLRILMTSQDRFMKWITKSGFHGGPGDVIGHFFSPRDPHLARGMDLFRKGGFGSVDEFAKLTHGKLPNELLHLKRLLTFVLAVHAPEKAFEDSDYYPFVQRLFEPDLHTPREDITVLTYNYDAYLRALTYRAFEARKRGLAGLVEPDLSNSPKLILELHGSISKGFGAANNPLHSSLLLGNADGRFNEIANCCMGGLAPNIYFPWEVVQDGKISDELKGSRIAETWEHAKQSVRDADKISIVGFSMHGFLADSIRLLFSLKSGDTGFELVVANADHQRQLPPGTPESRAVAAEKNPRTVSAKFRAVFEGKRMCVNQHRVYDSFKEFTEHEMDPV